MAKKLKQQNPFEGIRLDDLYKDRAEDMELLDSITSNAPKPVSTSSIYDWSTAPYFTEGFAVQQIPEYGESRYDEAAPTLPHYLDYQNLRGERQPWYDQLKNGILKCAITTGTAIINTLAGIPIGMLEATANGDVSKIWDNTITNFMYDIDEWAEKELPNYYTQAELDSPWYTNILTANLLGDKIIKNFGFTFGAGAAGKVISKVPKLLPKLITKAATAAGRTEKDVAAIGRAANSFSTSFVSAVGEGSLVALNATKEWSADMTNRINQEQSIKLQALQQEYEASLAAIQQQYGNTEMGQQIALAYQRDMQQKIQAIENETNQKMAQVASQRAQIGNAVLGFNLPILMLGNLMTLGKVFAKGYTAEMSSIGRHILYHPEDLANAGKTVTETIRRLTWRGLRDKTKEVTKQAFTSDLSVGKNVAKGVGNALWEGTEEMLQGWVSNASKFYNTDYYNQSVDPDYTDKTASMWKSLGDSFVDTFGNIDNWEEFAIGMLSGGISNMILGQTGEMRRERLAVNEAVNNLNNAVNTFSNREMIKGINRHQYLEDLKTHAAVENREKEYKDADFAQLASDVVLFGSLGKLDELKAIIDYNLENLSDSELDQLAEDLSQKEGSGPENNLFVKLDTAGKRKYLKDQQDKYHKVIDDYTNEYNELTALTGNLFSQEQMSELVYERLRTKNSSERAEEVKQDLKNQINQALEQRTSDRTYHTNRLDLHRGLLSNMRNQLTKWNRELIDLRRQEEGLRGAVNRTREYADRNRSNVQRDLDVAYENLYSADAYDEQLKESHSTTHKTRRKEQLSNSQKRIAQLEKQINKYQKILNEYEEGIGSKQRTRLDNLGKIYFEQINTTSKTSNLRDRAREEQAQIKLLQKLLSLDNTAIEGYNTTLEFIASNLDTIFDINSKKLYAGNTREAFMSILGLGSILSNLITSDSIENQKIVTGVTDITTLLADALNYNNRVSEFLQNPQRLEEKNEGIRERILNRRIEKEADKVENDIANTESFNEFSRKLNNLDPKVKEKVLQRLKNKQNQNAIDYNEKIQKINIVLRYINNSNESPEIKRLAVNLFTKASDSLSSEDMLNLDSTIYSRESNQNLDDETYIKVKTLLAQAFNYQSKETSEPKQTDTLNVEEKPVIKAQKPQTLQETIEELNAELDDEEGIDLNGEEQPSATSTVESVDTTPTPINQVTPESYQFNEGPKTPVIPINIQNNNLTTTEVELNEQESVTLPSNQEPSTKSSMAMGMQEIDTKAKSTNKGKPVIEEVDNEGKPTEAATNSRPLYEYLKSQGVFDAVDNGVVKKDSKVYFGVVPGLDRDIATATGYNGITILLYVDGRCVGHLPISIATKLGLQKLLFEEFNDKVNSDSEQYEPLISKYYTTVDDLWSGIILYNSEYRTLTDDDLVWVRNRLNSSTTSEEDRTPLITIFNGTTDFTAGSKKFTYGVHIAPVYMNNPLYKGAPVLLVPTGAYDRNKPNTNQDKKAFIPVALRRVKLKDIEGTTVHNQVISIINNIFNTTPTVKQLNRLIGELKKKVTYEFGTPQGNQQVFIVPARQLNREGNPIVEMTPQMFSNAATKFEDAKVTHLIIQRKINGKVVNSYTVGIAQGNFQSTQTLPQDLLDINKEAFLNFLTEGANAYVNIEQSRLDDPAYIQQIIDDGLLQTNAKELRVRGNSFHMKEEVNTDDESNPSQPEQSEQPAPQEPITNNNGFVFNPSDPFADTTPQEPITNPLLDLLGTTNPLEQPETEGEDDTRTSMVTETTSFGTIDIDKEISNILKVLPQLNREEAFKIVDNLIKVNNKGARAQGTFNKGLITLSKLAQAGTGYHEAYHLVFNMLLTDTERNDLFKEYQSKYPNLTLIELEERMADDFREYALLNENRINTSSWINRVSDKVLNWFKDLLNILHLYRNEPLTFNTVCSNIWQGKYAYRQLQDSSSIRLSDTVTKEMQDIKNQAIANGTFMKAPNGNPTNLNERQWLQVRTKAFKDWFGDWENDATNASKVVDDNGEPLVVYHGGAKGINIFKAGGSNTGEGYYENTKTGEKIEVDSANAMFFSNNPYVAYSYQTLYGIMHFHDLYNKVQSMIMTTADGKFQFKKGMFSDINNLYNILDELSEYNDRFIKFKEYIKNIKDKYGKITPYLTEKEVSAFRDMLINIRKEIDGHDFEWTMNTSGWFNEFKISRNIINKYNNKEGIHRLLNGEVPSEIKKEWEIYKKIENQREKEGLNKIDNYEELTLWIGTSESFSAGDYCFVYDGTNLLLDNTSLPDDKRMIPITKMSDNEISDFFNNALIIQKNDIARRKNASDFKKVISKGDTYAVFLNIRNPFIHDYEGTHQGQGYKQSQKNPFGYVAARQVKKAIQEGNDGVIYENLYDPYLATNYGVLNPNQIKSATDNIGTFSRENNDIRYSLIPQIRFGYNGPIVENNGNTFNIADLSKERFQRLVDSQVNNITYNTRTKSVDMNNRWGQLIDRWKSIGVNIKGTKNKNKYVVDSVTVDNPNITYYNQKWQQYLQQRVIQKPEDPFNIKDKCYVYQNNFVSLQKIF